MSDLQPGNIHRKPVEYKMYSRMVDGKCMNSPTSFGSQTWVALSITHLKQLSQPQCKQIDNFDEKKPKIKKRKKRGKSSIFLDQRTISFQIRRHAPPPHFHFNPSFDYPFSSVSISTKWIIPLSHDLHIFVTKWTANHALLDLFFFRTSHSP